MTRVLITMAAVWAIAASSASASTSEPLVTVVREADRALITLREGDLTVTQTLTRTALDVQLVQGADRVRIAGDLDGQVRVERGTSRHAFSMRAALDTDRVRLNALIGDSPALAAFDVVMRSDWARGRSAVPFVSARSFIRVLQGDTQTTPQVDVLPVTASLIRVRQRLSPSQCWDIYSRDVVRFTYDLQACLSQASANWWNPLHTAWCSYEYNLKSSLSAIWLLDCYGVPA